MIACGVEERVDLRGVFRHFFIHGAVAALGHRQFEGVRVRRVLWVVLEEGQVAATVVVVVAHIVDQGAVGGGEREGERVLVLLALGDVEQFAAGGAGQLVEGVVGVVVLGDDLLVAVEACRFGVVVQVNHIADWVVGVAQVLQAFSIGWPHGQDVQEALGARFISKGSDHAVAMFLAQLLAGGGVLDGLEDGLLGATVEGQPTAGQLSCEIINQALFVLAGVGLLEQRAGGVGASLSGERLCCQQPFPCCFIRPLPVGVAIGGEQSAGR